MHASALTQKLDCLLVADTLQQDMFVAVYVLRGGVLCSVVGAGLCGTSCDGADASS